MFESAHFLLMAIPIAMISGSLGFLLGEQSAKRFKEADSVHGWLEADIQNELRKFAARQEPLGPEFERVLNENMWELYEP